MKYSLFTTVISASLLVTSIVIMDEALKAQTTPTATTPQQITCGPGTGPSAIFVLIATGFGVPMTCAQFDAASFSLDKTTKPWTIRAIGTVPTFMDRAALTGAVDGVNASFTIPDTPNPSTSLLVVRNGLCLSPVTDFTLTGNTVTFVAAAIPQTGDKLFASYRK